MPVVPIISSNSVQTNEDNSLAAELNDDFDTNIEKENTVFEPAAHENIVSNYEQDTSNQIDAPNIFETIPVSAQNVSSQDTNYQMSVPELENELNLSPSDLETIWEGFKNAKESYESKLSSSIDDVDETFPSVTDILPSNEETNITENIPSTFEEEKEFNSIEPIKEEKEEKKLMEIIHEEIERDIPSINPTNAYDTNEVTADIYDEIGLKSDEVIIPKERDIKNLTLFKDYNDYVFTYGQQHYSKDALTPEELEALKGYKSFLDEKSFEEKRTTQYKRITNADKKLKKQITSLTKEFKKNTDSISKEYTKNVKELTKAMENAKKQAETDRLEKVQTQQLNDTLNVTLSEKNTNIEDLTERNTNLQETIEKQLKKIEELEKENSTQASKIKDFEDKFNTVFGIVQEARVIDKEK